MGIRFFKSIKIANGLKLNISKSGIGLSGGVTGARVSTSSKGTYLNLSLPGTGLGYSKKISSNGLGLSFSNILNNKKETKSEEKTKQVTQKVEKTALVQDDKANETIEQYQTLLELNTHMYKHTNNVVTKEDFDKGIEENQDKEKYQKLIDGDEETIEEVIADFISSLQLTYQTNVNYELEDHCLYVDIDLPEIEMLDKTYPRLMNDGKILYSEKSTTTLKQEYCDTVMALPIFLSANFFNLSSYINEICISGYTQKRNSLGDQVDEYIYSVKFTRDIFEKTNLQTIDNVYQFYNQFTNRINYQISGSFKAITPYENPFSNTAAYSEKVINETISGLKNLGYSDSEINSIKDKITDLNSTDVALKQALQLLAKTKN